VADLSAGALIRQSAPASLCVNRAPGGLFVYLGTRIVMLQAR